MIINLRGPSGSGKSTAVRTILRRWYKPGKPHFVVKRRQPLWYRHDPMSGSTPLYVVGHYETPCGGADTIAGQDTIYDLVRNLATRKPTGHVLFEGLIIGTEYKRAVQLHRDFLGGFFVFGLDTPIHICASSVDERRQEKKPDAPPMDPNKIRSKQKSVAGTMTKMMQLGLNAKWVDRNQVIEEIGSVLGFLP